MRNFCCRPLFVVFAIAVSLAAIAGGQDHEDINNYYRWMKTPWKASADVPFVKAKKEVFAALQGQQKMALLEKLRQEAKKRPADAVAQYKWGTAYVYLRRHGFQRLEHTSQLGELQGALQLQVIGDSYEYARLHFLIKAIRFPDKKLRPIAERLLINHADDFDVVYQYVDILDSFKDVKDRQKAITLSQWLIKKRPDWPGGYTTLGAIYARSWSATKKTEYLDLSIKSYKAALEKSKPPYDDHIENIKGMIKRLEKIKATGKVD